MTDHLLGMSLPTEEADLARYYTRGMEAGTAEEREVNDLAREVADGGLTYTQALDSLVSDHIADGGDLDDIDAVEERLGTLLSAAAGRFQHGVGEMTAATPRRDMHPLVIAGLGLDPARPVSRAEINCLLSGHRTDGAKVEGKIYAKPREFTDKRTGEVRDSTPIGSYDFCPTPDKSVSVAWGFAPPVEQAVIHTAHLESAREAVAYIAAEIGQARRGAGGEEGREPGHVGWVEFDHYTARRTVAIANDGATEFVPVPTELPGDPDIHTHFAVVNAVFCENGRVGSLDTNRVEGILFEADALYHARVGQRLRDAGFDVTLDPDTGAARMPAIPDEVRSHFSKRTNHGETAAREYATSKGLDFDTLTPAQRIGLLKANVQPKLRGIPEDADPETRTRIEAENNAQRKRSKDDVANFADWKRQGSEMGWEPRSFLAYGPPVPEMTREQRIEMAYTEALPFVERLFETRSTLPAWEIRRAAGQGLVAAGIEDTADIDAVTRKMREWGVQQYGEMTGLIWGQEEGRKFVTVSTALHEAQEREFISLAKAAVQDRSAALPAELLDRKIRESGLDFSDEHGRAQVAMIRRLGGEGRFGVAVAASGAGKTTALRPLVAAWKEDGRRVFGTSLASRQADDLTDAGIEQRDIRPVSGLLGAVKDGSITLDRNSVVAIDEWATIGTREGLELLRLRERRGFQLVALGDDKQLSSIAAGAIVDLSRRALGADAIPEILTTRRQQTEREREAVSLLRQGRAADFLAMKREGGSAIMEPGSYADAVKRVATLFEDRVKATGRAPTISAPTNMDAHNIGVEVRKVRRAMGEIGGDVKRVRVVDPEGKREYNMDLAVGDRVRLFKNTAARFANGRGGTIGRNGHIMEIRAIDDRGMELRSLKSGKQGRVEYTNKSLVGRNGRLLLAYGEAMTTHTAQGISSPEHISAFPGGTKGINGLQAYSGSTRHQVMAYLVTSQGAEAREVRQRRPLNDVRPATVDDQWANVARNLSAQPVKDIAVAFIDGVDKVRRGSVRMFQSAMHIQEQRVQRGRAATEISDTLSVKHTERSLRALHRPAERAVEAARHVMARDVAQREMRRDGPRLSR